MSRYEYPGGAMDRALAKAVAESDQVEHVWSGDCLEFADGETEIIPPTIRVEALNGHQVDIGKWDGEYHVDYYHSDRVAGSPQWAVRKAVGVAAEQEGLVVDEGASR